MPCPALRALIPYTLGIFIASFLPIPLFWVWLSLLICLSISLVTPVFCTSEIQRKRLSQASLAAAIFVCGMLRLGIALTSPIPSTLYNQQVHFSGRMTYQPDRGTLWDDGYAVGSLQSMTTPDLTVKTRLLIRFRDAVSLHYSDHLELDGELRQPKGKRNPGGFDYRSYLARRQVFGILYPQRNQRIAPIYRAGFPPLQWSESLRRHVESVIDKAYREVPEHALVLKGMLLGQRSVLPEKILSAFRNSGVLHILAVSGLHVGLIAGLCFLCFSLLPLPQKTIPLLTIAAVIIYACLVGFRPSVLRASIVAILVLLALLLDRDADPINLLAFAALLLLLVNPAQLWDIGFQLSFTATGTILYLLPRWNRLTARILTNGGRGTGTALKWLFAAFGVALSAQIGTSLIIAAHFYRVYPLSLIANLFAVGLAALIVSVALVSVLLSMVWLFPGRLFVAANHLLLFIFLKIIGFFGSQTGAVIKTPPPGLGFTVVYIAGCLAMVHWRWVWKQRKRAVQMGLAVVAICIWHAGWKERGNLLEITFLDVGQGDSAFARFPDGKTMLIDGGLHTQEYDSGERILEPFLRHEGVGKLDVIVLSHPDNDHGGGLAHVLREFRVGRVLGVPHRDLPSSTHQLLHRLIDERGIPHELGSAGEIDLTPMARIELLHPRAETSVNLTDSDVNNDSLVLKLTYGQVRILFTGDIEQPTENRLTAGNYNLRAEIIKVPHHGSKTSSSAEFLDAVHPLYAIFSLGERNRYGFPAGEVVNRYLERGCRVWRTDELGGIRLRTDGRRCWMSHYAEGPIPPFPAAIHRP